MAKPKRYLVLSALVILALFLVQNTETVTVNLLLWQLVLPRAVLLLLVLAIGVLIGLALPRSGSSRPAGK
ncbi:DUF1049 domain-containing protein [Exilibacterium tricleocarpae]|uniref:DUF1049 domain-containing protein n=1 Tax=Exilibacterium tricleocarpae TaxID=2591008 RepID=A0A545U6Q8_9GAMM|nr:lipopolysaccharide assembly protein LapA domain-containing protein [Exilibacterium tricleocarpae]TQV85161.1 DUF1049 domain-containing protein [Exilibacterium tricleocarpae]